MSRKTISQQKIAQELGVSQSLVSIVLNGRKEGIAEKTYQRIWDFALANGYSPKGMKLNHEHLISNEASMQTVGYFLRAPLRLATKSNFFSHVTQGMHEFLDSQQISTVFLGSESDFEAQSLDRMLWREKHLKGIVILGQVADDFLHAVRRLGKPIVYVSARSSGLCHSVNSNEYHSAEQLVDHLVGLGHRHFAFLGGLCARSRNEERMNAARRALSVHGIKMPESNVIELDDAERKQGFEMAEILLERNIKPFPTAWICVNGLAARGAINKLFQAGFDVGSDVSVAAFDMTRVCSEENPGITSAAAIPEKLGREAAALVLQALTESDRPMQDLILPSTLAIRASTGVPVPQKIGA
jgi:LacI family transcriptional regulator